MTAKRIGFVIGLAAFVLTLLVPAPAGMPPQAWAVAGLVVWMAAWWMTEAVPLTATALLPFLVLPLAGVMNANETAASYYSPTLFLILGGAFLALAIERTNLHCRLAVGILNAMGKDGGPTRLLLAFMFATALLSTAISNTSTALIMMPMAGAVLAGGKVGTARKDGLSGALPMGIAFAASVGGLGTIIGSPTNAIAVGLLEESIGVHISFVQWMAYGMPVVLIGVPLAGLIVARVQRVREDRFDVAAAHAAIATQREWSLPERRLVPLFGLAFLLWVTQPLTESLLPPGALTDGTIAVFVGLLLFIVPDGTGRPLLIWSEADRAPWGVIMMFGGGLALAAGMTASGLAAWLGQSLLPLSALPLWVVALAVTALVVLITEFASNVATASGIMPVVASLTVALGADPLLLALPAAMAASWGFMLPAGTGPNAIAWATGRIELKRMVAAGFLLDIAGVVLLVGTIWAVAALL
ncbi:MAG TPA: DASS family sodium-coupled anion symporter [Croceibacterium sp.]|nr:DASS family sodium-coupled anion symporter [Croceibacterium sp.]